MDGRTQNGTKIKEETEKKKRIECQIETSNRIKMHVKWKLVARDLPIKLLK